MKAKLPGCTDICRWILNVFCSGSTAPSGSSSSCKNLLEGKNIVKPVHILWIIYLWAVKRADVKHCMLNGVLVFALGSCQLRLQELHSAAGTFSTVCFSSTQNFQLVEKMKFQHFFSGLFLLLIN